MTARLPPKARLLRSFTIEIIMRVGRLSPVSSAYLAQLPELFETWQSVQFKPNEAAKNPIVSISSFTEIPLRT